MATRPLQTTESRNQLTLELLSGASGFALAAFMWGHMVLVGSILTGARGFDWLATFLEDYYIAQPTVLAIFILFVVHAALASRRIPSQLRERRKMLEVGRHLDRPGPASPAHSESVLWIWQVRTGMVILVLGSFHLVLLGFDVLTPMFGERIGIEAATSTARVRDGLWLPYAILLLCVEFHASIGLYRLAIKWFASRWLDRSMLRVIEKFLLWFFLGLGAVILAVLAGVLPPFLSFLIDGPVN